MDNKKLEAYKLANELDQQQAEVNAEERQRQIDEFLKIIGQIESSGGANFNHDLIKSGIHEGHRAAGTYGLMPNTVQEILNRMRSSGNLDDSLKSLKTMNPDEIKKTVETNPEIEEKLARNLASRVLDKQQDEEKAAYSWFQGHNLSPREIAESNYKDHDYVKKYNRFKNIKDKIGGK